MIKVAIDTGPLKSGHLIRGVGVNTKELIDSLLALKKDKISIHPVDFAMTDLSTFDVAHYTSFHPYFDNLPSQKVCKRVVVTIHDLIPLIYPRIYPPGLRGRINFAKQKKRLSYVDSILTISETSKKDIVRFLNLNKEKINVAYLGVKDIYKPIMAKHKLEKVTEKYNLPKVFALYVGDVNYNKNVGTLINACKLAGVPLVIAGKHPKEVVEREFAAGINGPQDLVRKVLNLKHPELQHLSGIRKLLVEEKILTLGFVDEEELARIYNLASVYLQSSFYEGFGLPVIEAMASGTPVVISRTNALVEIAGDSVLVASPFDAKDFAGKIKLIRDNKKLHEKLSKAGIFHAKKYLWANTAKSVVQMYTKLK